MQEFSDEVATIQRKRGLLRAGLATVGLVPRRKRELYPGVPTHLTMRGVDEQPIFLSELDRYELLALLRKVVGRLALQVHTWCLMTTHYHLLLLVPPEEDGAATVSRAMQIVNSVYAREFNARHRRRGHVFGERFADTVIESDRHGAKTSAYILDNPVRAGLVQRFDDWPWSGHETLRARDEVVTPATRNWHNLVRLGG